MRPVDVLGLTLEAGSEAPVVLLREQHAPYRVLPIFVGPREAMAIALALSGQSPPRPLTHDLWAALIEALDSRVDHVEVTDVPQGTFLAELAVRGPRGAVNLDSRPSDAIALALRLDAPLFASDAVLDEAGALISVEGGDQAIDEDVHKFRTFLDQVDPADFERPEAGGERSDGPGA